MHKTKLLVTGVNGFAGKHLVNNLHGKGVSISGCGHESEVSPDIRDMCEEYVACDLTDPIQVERLSLDGVTAVINLAGIAVNNPNEQDVRRVLDTNVRAHTVLYDRLKKIGSAARVVCVSTGAMYDPSDNMPLVEDSALTPDAEASAYVRSKQLLERALEKYSDLDLIVARPFNHTGPGQRPGFIVPDWAERIMKGEAMDVSRLSSWRDFSDVRDVVEAYARLALVEDGQLNHRVYNISTGIPRLGYDVISLLAREFGRELPPPRTEGLSKIYASHERLSADTGWQPGIDITQTIKDFADWRKSQD